MTSLLTPVDALVKRYDVFGRQANLLDRFWDAITIPLREINDNTLYEINEDDALYDYPFPSPELFSKDGCHPVVSVKAMRSPRLNDTDQDVRRDDTVELSSTVFSYRTTGECRRRERNDPLPPPRMVIHPAPASSDIATRRGSTRPTLAIPRDPRHREGSISSPGSAVLAQASKFVAMMSKLCGSQPPSALPTGEMGIKMVDSAVLVSVVGDVARSRRQTSSNQDTRGRHDDDIHLSRQALLSEHQGPSTSEEMDLMTKIGWETQLMYAQKGDV